MADFNLFDFTSYLKPNLGIQDTNKTLAPYNPAYYSQNKQKIEESRIKKPNSTPIFKPNIIPTAYAWEAETAPIAKPLTLFVDEQNAFKEMKANWLSDEQAYWLVKQRRQDLMQGKTWMLNEEVWLMQEAAKRWFTTEEAIETLLLKRQKESEQVKEQKKELYDRANPLQKLAVFWIDASLWAVSKAGQTVWNVLDFARIPWAWNIAQEFKQASEKYWVSESAWGKFWLTTFDIWTAIATPWAKWWLIKSWIKSWAAYWALQPITEKWRETTLWDITKGAAIWWATWWVIWAWLKVATPIISKWISTAVQKGQKYWTALTKWWVEWLWKSIGRDITKETQKIWQTIKKTWELPKDIWTRAIPQKIVERDLWFTPTQRETINKITGKTPAQYVLDKNLAWKWKEELAQIFDKQANDMYTWISKELKKIPTRVQSNTAKEALEDMLEQLTNKPKIAKAYAKDIAWIQAMLKKWDFTLDEINNIRRAYDKVNTWIYTAKWEIKSWLEAQIDVDIRRKLNDQLQKEALKNWVDVKEMNKELRVWIEMKDALLRRLSQEERNNFIGLQDLWISAILSGWEPISAIATIAAKKYAEKIAPWLSQKLYNLNKTANVPSRMTRGNSVITGNKSSKLGLTNNTSTNTASTKLDNNKVSLKNEVLNKVETPKTWWLSNKKGWFVNLEAISKDAKKLLPKSKVSNELINEAKKYNSADEFINKIWEDLYVLNKKAKEFVRHRTGDKPYSEFYTYKNNLLKNIWENTGKIHKFPNRWWFWELYKIWKETFHNFINNDDFVVKYNLLKNKKFSEIYEEMSKYLNKYPNKNYKWEITYEKPIKFYPVDWIWYYKWFNTTYLWWYPPKNIINRVKFLRKELNDLYKDWKIESSYEKIGDEFELVIPPREITHWEFSDDVVNRIKYISDNNLNKKQLNQIYEQANKIK